MSNFANHVEINIPEEHQDIFNTMVQSRKLMVEPTPTDQHAAQYVVQNLVYSGWNRPGANRDRLIINLARSMMGELDYLRYEYPDDTNVRRISQLIREINNYIINNDVARGHKRKTRKSKKSRKSRKSRRSRK